MLFKFPKRPEPIDRSKYDYDLAFFGAGPQGTAGFRTATMAGLRCALFEKKDIGHGDKSTSIGHKGIRYIPYMEFRLILESLKGMRTLQKIGPHLVWPLEFLFLGFNDSQIRPWMIKGGVNAVGLISHISNRFGPASVLTNQPFNQWAKKISKTDLTVKLPGIRTHGLIGGIAYHDCLITYPKRLCLENVQAATENGGKFYKHTKVINFIERDGVTRIIAQEKNGNVIELRTPLVINAAGPWVDEVNQNIKLKEKIKKQLYRSKGTHIEIDKKNWTEINSAICFEGIDKNLIFVIPTVYNRLRIGPTHGEEYTGRSDDVKPTREEIISIIKSVNAAFPLAQITEKDVVHADSGLRALPRPDRNGRKPEEISRKSVIIDHEKEDGVKGLISLTGGKLTTQTEVAKKLTNIILDRYGLPLIESEIDVPLPGARGIYDTFSSYKKRQSRGASEKYKKSLEEIDHLIDLYGSRYQEVLNIKADNLLTKQIIHSKDKEFAVTLNDIIRRLEIKNLEKIYDIAVEAAKVYRWTEEEVVREIKSAEKEWEKNKPLELNS